MVQSAVLLRPCNYQGTDRVASAVGGEGEGQRRYG